VLLDVSAVAREAGIRYPVVLTRAAWGRSVAVPSGVRHQDEAGRLWDVLTTHRFAIRRSTEAARDVGVRVRNDNRERTPPLVRLQVVCGPGDQGEPVIMVMLPDEVFTWIGLSVNGVMILGAFWAPQLNAILHQ
jgi:hypothetical protein